jgi:predicted nucleic acid-binding protein
VQSDVGQVRANRPSVDLMIAAIALEFGYAFAMRNVSPPLIERNVPKFNRQTVGVA